MIFFIKGKKIKDWSQNKITNRNDTYERNIWREWKISDTQKGNDLKSKDNVT